MNQNQEQILLAIIRNSLRRALYIHPTELHHQLKHAFSNIECKVKSNIPLSEAISTWIEKDLLRIINEIDLSDSKEKQTHIQQIKKWLKVKDIIEQFKAEMLKTM